MSFEEGLNGVVDMEEIGTVAAVSESISERDLGSLPQIKEKLPRAFNHRNKITSTFRNEQGPKRVSNLEVPHSKSLAPFPINKHSRSKSKPIYSKDKINILENSFHEKNSFDLSQKN